MTASINLETIQEFTRHLSLLQFIKENLQEMPLYMMKVLLRRVCSSSRNLQYTRD